jgi:hypothetical protein
MTDILALEQATTYHDIAGKQVAASYGNDEAARVAIREGCALANRSHWGLIRLTGSTRLNYLHNQTTNDFKRLQPGQGTETVFVTATARVVDLVTALVAEDAVWLLTSPERREVLLNWMPRFVFFTDDVQFRDESDNYAIFSLVGPTSSTLITAMGAEAIVGQPLDAHSLVTLAGVEGVRAVVGGGLGNEGYTLIVPLAGAGAVWTALRQAGAEPLGADLWEMLRVEQGRPSANRELTEEHNPLEAGLWQAVSFSKGCYIGQEIIARLDTYQKLKQQLWGLRLSAPVPPGTPVLVEDKELGTVTSMAETPNGPFALAYLRTKGGEAGVTARVGEATATVVELPYVTRGRADL